MLNFSANLSTMFMEYPLLERFKIAESNGFRAFELQDHIYSFPPESIKSNCGELKCDLINCPGGSTKFGCAAIPGYEVECLELVQMVLPYHLKIGLKKMHIMSGKKLDRFKSGDQVNAFVNNLKSISEILEEHNLNAVIEPICGEVVDNYFLNRYDMAVDILKEVNSPYVKLLLDVYHLHKITGDIHKNLEIYYPYAGHIQISQEPGRVEPFHKDGVIDYSFVFDFLNQQQHRDYIGLEYFPSGSTKDSLDWIKNYTS